MIPTPRADRCPCGSGDPATDCCDPYLSAVRLPPTAEALMRSRYTAFATGDRDYLLATWHPSTRPSDLELEDSARWRRLDVLHAHHGGPWDDAGTVEFIAHYRDSDASLTHRRGQLHETSRFVREDGRWFYVDGTVA